MGIRRALLIALVVPALVAGLLAMHTLSGSGHTAHASGPATAVVAAEAHHAGAAVAGAEASDRDGDLAATAAALSCVLALLATLLLAAAADPLRAIAAPLFAAVRGLIAPGRRRHPARSLVELSISRT